MPWARFPTSEAWCWRGSPSLLLPVTQASPWTGSRSSFTWTPRGSPPWRETGSGVWPRWAVRLWTFHHHYVISATKIYLNFGHFIIFFPLWKFELGLGISHGECGVVKGNPWSTKGRREQHSWLSSSLLQLLRHLWLLRPWDIGDASFRNFSLSFYWHTWVKRERNGSSSMIFSVVTDIRQWVWLSGQTREDQGPSQRARAEPWERDSQPR